MKTAICARLIFNQALRTLKLLEQYHQKLAELLKFRSSHPIDPAPKPRLGAVDERQQPPHNSEISQSGQRAPSIRYAPPVAQLQRESSSSIATSLASARGIPQNRQQKDIRPAPILTTQHAEGKVLNPIRRTRPAGPVARAAGNVKAESIAAQEGIKNLPNKTLSDQTSSSSDDTFNRFYSTFEGLLSKISAPLAFTGLPLNPDESPERDTKAKSRNEETFVAEADIAPMFSKAALHAVREELGPGGGGFGGAESFYVVPTTGGTISYAGILARTGRASSMAAGEDDFGDDDFVDARETPQSNSPDLRRRMNRPGMKTMEELQLENGALRALADDLSKRLHRFEMGAQSSSMALQMSMRAMQSPTASEAGHGGIAHEERLRFLEEQLEAGSKEMDNLRKRNAKLEAVNGRHKERWERLKEGARGRSDGAGKVDASKQKT